MWPQQASTTIRLFATRYSPIIRLIGTRFCSPMADHHADIKALPFDRAIEDRSIVRRPGGRQGGRSRVQSASTARRGAQAPVREICCARRGPGGADHPRGRRPAYRNRAARRQGNKSLGSRVDCNGWHVPMSFLSRKDPAPGRCAPPPPHRPRAGAAQRRCRAFRRAPRPCPTCSGALSPILFSITSAAEFRAGGQGIYVRPHPHIGLATDLLFRLARSSSRQPRTASAIRPG